MACNNIADSYLKFGGESMSAIRFRTKEKGNLPHLSYILLKPDPLGEELKLVACSVTGALLFIDVHRRKEWKNHVKYQNKLGATLACTKIMV